MTRLLGPTDPVLSIDRLNLRRSETFSLSVPDLEVSRGEVVCLAGANGSGKTTLIQSVVGLLPVACGTIRLHDKLYGRDDPAKKLLFGFIPDDDSWVIPELTAREYFSLLASIYRQAGVKHDLDAAVVKLAATLLFTSLDQPIGSLSHGNRKKVQIIAGLMHRPMLIVADELRNGLDPIAIKRAEQLLRNEARRGAAILTATHDLWWAERFADRIVMLHQGKVVLSADTADIVEGSGSVEAKFFALFGDQT